MLFCCCCCSCSRALTLRSRASCFPLVPARYAVDGHRQFVLSLRWGRVLDRPALLTLLTGSDAAAADARAAAERAASGGGQEAVR